MVISGATSATLNTVRALSAVLVVIGHGLSYGKLAPTLAPPRVPWIQELAVVAFFWMSGFLVASALDRVMAKGQGAQEFILARAVRIFLPLWPALVLTWGLDLAHGEQSYTENRTISIGIANGLALHGVPGLGIPPFGSNRPLWTVAVEWWIYVVAAILAFRPRNPLALVVGGLAFFVVLSNLLGSRGSGLAVTWGLGALGWLAYRRSEAPQQIMLLTGSAVVFIAGVRWMWTGRAYDWAAQIFFSMGASIAMLGLRGLSVPRAVLKGTEVVALPSYSLYLVHYPIMIAIGQPFGPGDLALLLMASCLVSIAFTAAFEIPRQWVYSRILNSLQKARHA
jgi:peptidoglycan/LPS O-acetylase OafA/YrhL